MSEQEWWSDWLGEPPEIPEESITETIISDVVVCGGGNAGMNVAKAAAEHGASVSVLEKQKRENYRFIGEQIGHFNSNWLRRHGVPDVDVGEVVDEFQKRSGNRSNAVLISQYVRNSGEMFDSLVDLVPKDHPMFKTVNIQINGESIQKYPYIQSGYRTWSVTACFRRKILDQPVGGVAAMSYLTDLNMYSVRYAEELGAKWYFDTNCVVLIRQDGRVTGCIARCGAGKYMRFVARKGVALCCGDFAGNNKMCVALLDEVRECARINGMDLRMLRGPGQDGSGIRMGCWAGGHMEPPPRACQALGRLGGSLGATAMLALNCQGKRFCDESSTPAVFPSMIRQPPGKIAGLFDNRWLEYLKHLGVDHYQPDFGVPQYIEQAQEDMKKAVEAGAEGYPVRRIAATERNSYSRFYAAGTLPELADYLGYEGKDKETFLREIARYNEICRAGRDEYFGKAKRYLWPLEEPPYFGTLAYNTKPDIGLVTLTGLVTDEHHQVLGSDGKTPIPGLYASGNCMGGRYALNYSTPCAGNSIGMAMTHGRLLGKYLADL